MSDTPTDRFPEPTGDDPTRIMPASPAGPDPAADAPTERFVAPPPPTSPTPPTGSGDEPKKSKALLITLISIGSALLLAIIILLIILLNGNGSAEPEPSTSTTSESPSPTPTTPSPSPSETDEPPAVPGPSIASYTANPTSVDCAGGGPVPVTFAWNATGTTLWFGVGTNDASQEPFGTFPLQHSMEFNYQCGQPDAQQVYTITVQGEDGTKVSQSVVIRETS